MTSPGRKSRGILFHLMFWVILSLVLVTLGVIVVFSFLIDMSLEKNLSREADQLAGEIAESMKEAVWNMDDSYLADHLANLHWPSLGVAQINVTTQFGDPIFIGPYSPEPEPVFGRAPVVYQGETIGSVIVGKSRHRISQAKHAVGGATLMVFFSALATLLIACSAALRLTVVLPVRKTVAGLRQIASGDYDFRLGAARGKEINIINQEINTMAAEIARRQQLVANEVATRRQAQAELRKLNRNLEKHVAARTERLRRLATQLATAQDEEQKRIAEGLHDDVAQLVAAARMKINQVSESLKECQACGKAFAEADDMIRQAYERIRLLSFELASSTLYNRGLAQSLQLLCRGMSERYDADFNLTCSGHEDADLDPACATVLFKSGRELMFNVVKHAGVREALLQLNFEPRQVSLTIEDRGRGFAAEDLDFDGAKGLGLFSIRERLRDIDGDLTIDSQPGIVTRVTLSIPVIEKGDDHEDIYGTA
ncbi:MAG: histidine kinase [Lentisphaeria bacterium]|nr:histidine kinase [Lentisphaeria bacterium]